MHEIEIDGVTRGLGHLQSFNVVLKGKGKDGSALRVAIHLRLHTISRAPRPGEVSNMLDENGKPRVFCEDRYSFSLGLPAFAKRMVEEKYFCWESSDGNRAVNGLNYAIVDAAPGQISSLQDGEHRVAYFYLYPAGEPRTDVDLYIVSCYVRYMSFSKVRRRFDTHMLLRKCLYEGKRLP